MFSPLLRQLIEALQGLPGVGPKTAQRMALCLLETHREKGGQLATALSRALREMKKCALCRMFCEAELCALCTNGNRDSTVLCIVESPAHLMAIEQTRGYCGLYFVLAGHLSPIDGKGPQEIGVDALIKRLEYHEVKEVILATSVTVEGEVTSHYLAELVKSRGIPVTRIAQGVPMGGDLEYIDRGTLARALLERSEW